jgi:hypothetical protein
MRNDFISCPFPCQCRFSRQVGEGDNLRRHGADKKGIMGLALLRRMDGTGFPAPLFAIGVVCPFLDYSFGLPAAAVVVMSSL